MTFPGHLRHWIWQEINPTLVSPGTSHSHSVPTHQAGGCPDCLKELLLPRLPLSCQGDFPLLLSMLVCAVELRVPWLCSRRQLLLITMCQHQGQGKVMPQHGLGISFLCGSPFLLLLHQLSGSLLHCPVGVTLTLPHRPAPAEWDLKQRVRGHISSAPASGTAQHHCLPSVALSPAQARSCLPFRAKRDTSGRCSSVPGAGAGSAPRLEALAAQSPSSKSQGSIPKPQTCSRSKAVSKCPPVTTHRPSGST